MTPQNYSQPNLFKSSNPFHNQMTKSPNHSPNRYSPNGSDGESELLVKSDLGLRKQETVFGF